MHREFLALSFGNGHLQDNICAHRNAAKNIVRFSHRDQVVTTIFGGSEYDIYRLQRLSCLHNSCATDVWSIRANHNRIQVAPGLSCAKYMQETFSQLQSLLWKALIGRGRQERMDSGKGSKITIGRSI